jgi:hypothetical protein
MLSAGAEHRGVVVHAERSFFGVHRVLFREEGEGEDSFHLLIHGTTLHGAQSLAPDRRREPLTYFYRTGPVGQAFAALNEVHRLQEVAVIGLGAGSLGCYGQAGQQWTFYEIDPLITETALNPSYFTFLRDCSPDARIVLGDGRLSLTKADDRQFDLIVIDAFSSDSIPMHLITRESLALYLDKLAPHGLLAYHVSNLYLDLRPVLANLALDADLASLEQHDQDVSEEDARLGKTPSEWVIMARTAEDFAGLDDDPRWKLLEGQPEVDAWTDDFSSITSVLRWQ